MKKNLLFYLLILFATFNAKADYLVNIPQVITQPNGEIIHCFASGDEFFNWLHDENGFTIIQNSDGYYYYATQNKGKLVASRHKVGSVEPAKKGLTPGLKISREQYFEKRKAKFETDKKSSKAVNKTGVLNGITIYIRFADDSNFLQQDIARIQRNFDDLTTNSVRHYFQTVSYGQLDIRTSHIPANNTSVISTYVSTNNRNHYQPRNATTNPNGYRTDDNNVERAQREFQLLRDAINWARTHHSDLIPDNISSDGVYADLVNFVIKGNSEGWNDLLWAHKWSLQTVGSTNYETVIKGNIRVKEFTFLPENQTTVRTLCHEVFHVLSAPDLYRYDTAHNHVAPTGRWDLMETGNGHMLSYMKMKYGGWISSNIPEIRTAGTYTLRSQGKNRTSNLFKIPGNSSEYFLVEYRQRTDDSYEANLPGSGLIVTRINPAMNGSANYNGRTVFDEVFVLRPGGSVNVNGAISNANLSDRVGRTTVSKEHAIAPFYSNGTFADFTIFDVVDFGDSIQFKFAPMAVPDPINITGKWHSDSIFLSWTPSANQKNVILVYDTLPIIDNLQNGNAYQVGNALPSGSRVLFTGSDSLFVHRSIELGKTYYYKLFTNSGSNYSPGITIKFSTLFDSILKFDTIDNFIFPADYYLYSWTAGGANNFVTGHNTWGYSRFVEHYKNDAKRRVHGLRFYANKVVRHNQDASIYMSVWNVDRDGMPDRELSVEEISYRDIRNDGWSTYYFKNPPSVDSDFFIGLTIRYRSPLDTFALLATIDTVKSRPITSYFYWNNSYMSYVARHGTNIAFAYRPILSSGGFYLTSLPQWFNASTNGVQNQIIDVYSTYSDYEVVCNDEWVSFWVDKNLDRIFVDVDPTETNRIGKILIVAEKDTTSVLVYQGAASSVQKDAEMAISLFPNPSADGVFYLQSDGGDMQLDVFDIMGRTVWSRKTFSHSETIDLSRQKNGTYFLRIVKNGQQKTFKLIKQ
ncbi:MAG: T9SS type A sorting domain-containing protein [Bacteroidales bacterium]|jgi:M6 family metalloprotease-like protein|nr:T9SS type A sorting domain-containing protein [Bacteroidales bacterium]